MYFIVEYKVESKAKDSRYIIDRNIALKSAAVYLENSPLKCIVKQYIYGANVYKLKVTPTTEEWWDTVINMLHTMPGLRLIFDPKDEAKFMIK